ncbi:hypothetical protein C8R46DRAFT_1046936 [Mycena filopes]|nr:hypothetical protein C8R46DRAFT_1046936 [Mycena filopes]
METRPEFTFKPCITTSKNSTLKKPNAAYQTDPVYVSQRRRSLFAEFDCELVVRADERLLVGRAGTAIIVWAGFGMAIVPSPDSGSQGYVNTLFRTSSPPSARRRARTAKWRPPSLTSQPGGPTEYQLMLQREHEREMREQVRREKARVRIAMKRAALRCAPQEDQDAAAERERVYQATYRERRVSYLVENRSDLAIWEAQRRIDVYVSKHGKDAYLAYARAKRDRRRRAQAKQRAANGFVDDQPISSAKSKPKTKRIPDESRDRPPKAAKDGVRASKKVH